MREYILKTSCGERINSIMACSEMEAIIAFAKIKVLGISDLLLIFTVESI